MGAKTDDVLFKGAGWYLIDSSHFVDREATIHVDDRAQLGEWLERRGCDMARLVRADANPARK